MTSRAPKADLKREIGTYAAARGRFDLVTVTSASYLAIDGHGDPNTSGSYADALGTIYRVAYACKFWSKTELGRDYSVMPLEALWWADDLSVFAASRDKSRWDWTVLIMSPPWLEAEHVALARERVRQKGGAPSLDQLRIETLSEGLAVQTLHVGPYDDEGPVLQHLHETFLPDHGLQPTGKHHEIYLSDARRTAPESLRTILRQPVGRK